MTPPSFSSRRHGDANDPQSTRSPNCTRTTRCFGRWCYCEDKTQHQSDGVSVWRWGQVRSGSEVGEGPVDPLRPAHTFTPVLYVACLFNNHIMQIMLDVSTNASFLVSAPASGLFIHRFIRICLRYLSEFNQRRLTSFHWLLNLSYCLNFALCCYFLSFFYH